MVHLDVDDPQKYNRIESVYLDLHGERIPFFIKSFQVKSQKKAIALFQDFESLEDAETLQGLEMYIPIRNLPSLKGKQFYFHEIIGFSVTDQKHGNIGYIERVLELPHQSLFQIKFNNREILIPVVDEIIKKVDKKKKILRIAAPEGLIDIYL